MEGIRLDPLLDALLRASLAILFAAAALHKARRPREFVGTLAAYEIVPRRLLAPAATGLVAIESALAIGLVSTSRMEVSLTALALLVVYGAAIAVNLFRDRRDIDCGCLGPAAGHGLSWGLVLRNAVLALGAVVTLLPTSGRSLHAIDAISFAGGLVMLILIFQALQGLAMPRASQAVREGAR